MAYPTQLDDMVNAFIVADQKHNSMDECALREGRTVYNVVNELIEKHPDSEALKALRNHIEKKTIRNKVCDLPASPEGSKAQH